MEKTDAKVFSPNPFLSDLIRVGVVPVPSDDGLGLSPAGGRPRKDGDPLIPVAGRVTTQTRKMLTMIVEAQAIPGVDTVTDAVNAAVTLWVELVHPRLKQNGLTFGWQQLRAIKRRYDSELARVKMVEGGWLMQKTLQLILAREDYAELAEAVKDAWAVMENLDMGPALAFQNRVLGDKPDPLLVDVWEKEGYKPEHYDFRMARENYLLPEVVEEAE